MLSSEMLQFGRNACIIREISAYGAARSAEIGPENVFDFSIGNPNLPAPPVVRETLLRLLTEEDPVKLHAYTPAVGLPEVREAVARHITETFGLPVTRDSLYITEGASTALAMVFHAMCRPGDEVILFAPYFTEYPVFVRSAGAVPVEVPCAEPDFQIDFEKLEAALSEKTAAVIVNSPNNPSGVVLEEATIRRLCQILAAKEREVGHPIYLVSDEPYRDLVYDEGMTVPYLPNYYDNTFVCYSYSKNLSIPGERLGYLLVSPRMADWRDAYDACCGAARTMGYICTSSLFQKLLPACLGATVDLSVYRTNRDLLCGALREYGFTVARPGGAFYLFVKSPEPDAFGFYERAKRHEILLVPGDDFGYPGYVRVSYCVDTDKVRRALPGFRALAEEYGLL